PQRSAHRPATTCSGRPAAQPAPVRSAAMPSMQWRQCRAGRHRRVKSSSLVSSSFSLAALRPEASGPCSFDRGDDSFPLCVSHRSACTFSDRGLPVNALDRTLFAGSVCDIGQSVYRSWEPALAEMSDFKAMPPVGTDLIGATSEGVSLYERIREDIIEGRL